MGGSVGLSDCRLVGWLLACLLACVLAWLVGCGSSGHAHFFSIGFWLVASVEHESAGWMDDIAAPYTSPFNIVISFGLGWSHQITSGIFIITM